MKKHTSSESDDHQAVAGWFSGRLPDDWFTGPPTVSWDRDELMIIGELTAPQPDDADQSGESWRRAAESARIERFREQTRGERMKIASAAEAKFERKVTWGASCGDTRSVFTALSVPMMTRLRLDERIVLDTLVDASVARSRSEALAWCVKLVAQHQGEWIGELRDALTHVEKVRGRGPGA